MAEAGIAQNKLYILLNRSKPMPKSTAQQFLEIAHADLEAARLLYSHGHFSHAIFALQQSVEKTMKALGLEVGVVSFEDLATRSLGHRAYNILRFGTKQMVKDAKKLLDLLETYPSAVDLLPIPKKAFQLFHRQMVVQEGTIASLQPAYYAELSATDFARLFKSFKKAASTRLDFPVEDFQKQMVMWLQAVTTKGIGNSIIISDVLAFYSDSSNARAMYDVLEKTLRVEVWATQVLFQLSVITTAHEADTRYPCEHGQHHPADYYQYGLPLVDNLEKLMEWQERCWAVMKGLISPRLNLKGPKTRRRRKLYTKL